MARYVCPKCGGPQFTRHQTVREVQIFHYDDERDRWIDSDSFGYQVLSVDLVYCVICKYDLNGQEIAEFSESLKKPRKE